MTSIVDYALLAGAVYLSNRPDDNIFPVPSNWAQISGSYFINPSSGFEAATYTNGSEIVMSFAGTDFSSLLTDFEHGNIPLALG